MIVETKKLWGPLWLICLLGGVVAVGAVEIDTVPIFAEQIRATLSYPPESNLLAAKNGTHVIQVPSNPAFAERLIDGIPRIGWHSAERFAGGRPIEILFRLSAARELASLLIQPQISFPGVSMPQVLEILVANSNEPNAFVSLGSYRLQREGIWQRLYFPPHKTAFLKLRIHTIHGSGPVGLGEVTVFAPGADVRAPHYYYEPAAVPPVVKQPKGKTKITSLSMPVGTVPAVTRSKPAKTSTTAKQLPIEQRIADALKDTGYGTLFFYLRDDKQAVLTGLVSSERDRKRAVKIVRGFSGVRAVRAHLLSGSPGEIHVRNIRLLANAATQSAGLSKVQVRMRKRGELILVGQVRSNKEEQIALAIARSQPGISKIVNQLKK